MSNELTGHLEQVDIEKIIVEDRERTDYGDIDELARSIAKKGIIQPLIVDSSYRLVAGGRRYSAAIMAGKTKVPCLVGNNLSDLDRKELELLENLDRKDFSWQEEVRVIRKLHEMYKAQDSAWSGRKTAERLGKSKSQVADQIKLACYMDELPELSECKLANDAWKAINSLEEVAILEEMESRRSGNRAETQSLIDDVAAQLAEYMADKAAANPGDLPIEGATNVLVTSPNSNYFIQDFFEAAANMPDEVLGIGSIIECDPPYGIDLQKIKKEGETDDYNEIPQNEYVGFLNKLAETLYRLQADQSTLIFWYAHQWYDEVCTALADAGYMFSRIPAAWVKLGGGQSLQPRHLLASNYEPFILARKGKSVPLGKPGASNVFLRGPVSPQKKIHPTERPVELIKEVLETCCILAPNTKCMVPFLGSGNTLRACDSLGISSFGFDLTDTYKLRYEARKAGVEI